VKPVYNDTDLIPEDNNEMAVAMSVYMEQDVLPLLIHACRIRGLDRFLLVADSNTYAVLGRRTEAVLRAQGWDVRTVMLADPEVIPDERTLIEVLIGADAEPRTYLAVGSGTITDLVRFCSYRTRNAFLALPTAPSVDGFASIGSALIVKHTKRTINGQPPEAIFADLETLCQAPRPMIAAGFGDMLGKATSLGDWRLGGLLWDEPFDEAVWQKTRQALQNCIDLASEIDRASCTGVAALLEGLVESGRGMVEVGSSRPAGGSEHQLSHFWEMKLLREGRPGILHGAKVGTATVLIAGYYAQVRGMDRAEAARRLATTPQPDRASDVALLRQVYGGGEVAEGILADQAPFLDLTPEAYQALQKRVLDRWDEIQVAVSDVPAPGQLAALLRQAGAAADPRELGLHDDEITQALAAGHLLRDRFTIIKLCRLLGLHS
jgi:glycerol-1-phosphate dehydrogenase [NAD(P)+]